MCRQNQLWGCALMALGLGVLIGIWLKGGFFCSVLGFGLLVAGFLVGWRK